jgi:hypothetical protein
MMVELNREKDVEAEGEKYFYQCMPTIYYYSCPQFLLRFHVYEPLLSMTLCPSLHIYMNTTSLIETQIYEPAALE